MTAGRLAIAALVVVVTVAACGGGRAAPEEPRVIVIDAPDAADAAPPLATTDAGSTGGAEGSGEPPSYTVDARVAYQHAKDQRASGDADAARESFVELKRRFPYSRFARESELQVIKIDLDAGKTSEGETALRKYIKEHPTDPRQQDLLEIALDMDCKGGQTRSCDALKRLVLGDATCKADADCMVSATPPCCSCCTGAPKAIRKGWWKEQTAACGPRDQCSECILSCPLFEPAKNYRAVCVQNACSLKRR